MHALRQIQILDRLCESHILLDTHWSLPYLLFRRCQIRVYEKWKSTKWNNRVL